MWLSVSDFRGFASGFSLGRFRRSVQDRRCRGGFSVQAAWLTLQLSFSPSSWLLCKVRYAVPEFWPAHENSCYSDGVDYAEHEARVYASVPEALPR